MRTQRMTIPIYNLGCGGGETRLVERALRSVSGVTEVYVNPATEMAYVEYDPAHADSTQLFTALERAGFGQPTPRPAAPPIATLQPIARLDTRRLALAAGIWLAGLYTLCLLGDLLFPTIVQMYRFWELLLIGFDWTKSWTLPLGLVEAFLYGAFGGWSFAALYNALPGRVGAPTHSAS